MNLTPAVALNEIIWDCGPDKLGQNQISAEGIAVCTDSNLWNRNKLKMNMSSSALERGATIFKFLHSFLFK